MSAPCEILSFCPDAVDVFALQGCCAVLIGSLLQTTNKRCATSLKSDDLSVSLYPSKTPYKSKATRTSYCETALSYFTPTIIRQFSNGTKGQDIIESTKPGLLDAIQTYDV